MLSCKIPRHNTINPIGNHSLLSSRKAARIESNLTITKEGGESIEQLFQWFLTVLAENYRSWIRQNSECTEFWRIQLRIVECSLPPLALEERRKPSAEGTSFSGQPKAYRVFWAVRLWLIAKRLNQ